MDLINDSPRSQSCILQKYFGQILFGIKNKWNFMQKRLQKLKMV